MATTEIEFTFDEAVHTMGVTPERLSKLIADGKIPVRSDGLRTLISRKAILDYMASVSALTGHDPRRQRNQQRAAGQPSREA